jgi:hypothetical protein
VRVLYMRSPSENQPQAFASEGLAGAHVRGQVTVGERFASMLMSS